MLDHGRGKLGPPSNTLSSSFVSPAVLPLASSVKRQTPGFAAFGLAVVTASPYHVIVARIASA